MCAVIAHLGDDEFIGWSEKVSESRSQGVDEHDLLSDRAVFRMHTSDLQKLVDMPSGSRDEPEAEKQRGPELRQLMFE